MTEQKRDAAADLAMCERATPGPWESFKSAHNELNGMPWGWIDARSNGRQLWVWSGNQNKNWENDNRFVTIAREALPYWIKQAVEAERLLESHGPEGRNYTNAEFVEMRSRAQSAEARVAELEAEVERIAEVIHQWASEAWKTQYIPPSVLQAAEKLKQI